MTAQWAVETKRRSVSIDGETDWRVVAWFGNETAAIACMIALERRETAAHEWRVKQKDGSL